MHTEFCSSTSNGLAAYRGQMIISNYWNRFLFFFSRKPSDDSKITVVWILLIKMATAFAKKNKTKKLKTNFAFYQRSVSFIQSWSWLVLCLNKQSPKRTSLYGLLNPVYIATSALVHWEYSIIMEQTFNLDYFNSMKCL